MSDRYTPRPREGDRRTRIYSILEVCMKMLLLPLVAFTACCSVQRPCIQPPPTEDKQQYQIGVNVAATLASAPVGGNLGVNFSNAVDTQYDKLGDNDKSLYLFLTAIQCYLKEGQAGADVAKTMAELVKTKWASKEPAAPLTAKKPTIVQVVQSRSPDLAPKINELLGTLGVKP